MTSPHAPSSDVVAGMAVERPPEANFTAGDTSQAEANATIQNVAEVDTLQTQIIAEEDRNELAVKEEGVKVEEESRPIVTEDDAAIPVIENEARQEVELLPASLPDFSQMGPIDSLLAYAQPFPILPTVDYTGLTLTSDLAGLPEPFLNPSPHIHEQDETRISAYAKLEFSDGEFYMNTYSVILGRDQKAMREALRREQDERKRIDEEASATREPKTPVNMRREQSKYTKSVVSESGGILREVDDLNPEKRRKVTKKSKSTGSSSRLVSRRNSLIQPNKTFDYQAQPIASHNATENGARPNLAALRPNPHDCPLVNIHPPATESVSGYKAISREHVKIAYSLKKHLFEAHILGRNGAFIDEIFYHQEETVDLKSGSFLQIGEVLVRFVLPDVAVGETGADQQRASYEDNPVSERYSEGGKEMSFDFEDSIHDGIVRETSSSSEEERGSEDDDQIMASGDENEDQGDVGMMDDSDRSSEGDDEPEEIMPSTESVSQQPSVPGKKRGPGRPPKDGIMSKREKQLAKKAAARALAEGGPMPTLPQAQPIAQSPSQAPTEGVSQESPTAKKTTVKTETNADGTLVPGVPVKNKVGRPRKHPRPDTPPIQREKRKYTKRKPKEPKEGEGKEGGGSGGEEAKEKKKDKPTKPPRSPSPTFNEADLTPEQLAKPQANYVTLIHEALSSSAAGMMSLPQIYRAIMRKYPFFVLKCSTTGWQSSVRHNLSQHHAFKKVERDGKGWMWAIVEGVSIEKEKKRRVTPPPPMPHMHHQPIYQAGHPPHMMSGQYPMPPPGYMLHPNLRPGQPYMGQPMNGHPYPHGPPPMHINPHQHAAPGLFPSIPQIAAIAPPQQYSSPYGPKPTAPQPPPQPPNPQNIQQASLQGPPQGLPQAPSPNADQKSSTPGAPTNVSATPVNHGAAPPSQQHQSPYQNHSHPPQQNFHHAQPHQAAVAPTPPPPQQPVQAQTSRPQHHQSVINAVEAFRTNLLTSLKDKTDNAEAILVSAINRALGYSTESTVPGDNFEPRIYEALQTILVTIPEYKPIQNASSNQAAGQQSAIAQPLQSHASQERSQRNVSQQSPKLSGSQTSAPPAVMRPSFNGVSVSRPSGSSVPRPPITTPGMSPGLMRTNSASPAVAASSQVNSVPPVEPAMAPASMPTQISPSIDNETPHTATVSNSTTIASTIPNPFPEPVISPRASIAVQVGNPLSVTTGPSIPLPVSTSVLHIKPMETTALAHDLVPTPAMIPASPSLQTQTAVIAKQETKIERASSPAETGQKRQIDEIDGKGEEELPEFKRISATGLPQLKT